MQTDPAAAGAAASTSDLVVRRYAGADDIPEIVRITNAELAADRMRERLTVGDLTAEFRHASHSFDPARDVLVAELAGRSVGTVRIDVVDNTDGTREFRSRGAVEPELRRRGIGRRLLHEAWALMRRRAEEQPTERALRIGMWVDEQQAGRAALARSEGYQPVRWFFEMERAGLDRDLPAPPPLPEGLEMRPASGDDAPAIWAADHEAFLDHWGGWDTSEAGMRRWVESPEFQPHLFLVAWEGDQIAGAVLNAIYAEENDELGLRRGWLDSVFTRRPWRGRGLARALIMRSLHLLAAHGMDTAALGVDADNPSGALGLYESCGFVVSQRGAVWQRPWEEG